MPIPNRLANKIYYSYNRFEDQTLPMSKIKWSLDLMIKNNIQRVKHKKKKRKKLKHNILGSKFRLSHVIVFISTAARLN